MTNHMRKFMVFAIALAMAGPATLGFGESEAFAAPGDMIERSKNGATRKSTRKKSKTKSKTKSRTTTRTTTRGTTTRRVPGTTTRRTISRDEARRRGATTTTTRTRTRTPERTTTRTRTRYGRDGGTTTTRTRTRTDRGRTSTTTTTRRRTDDRYDRGRTTTTRTRDRYDRGRTTTTTRRDRDRYGNSTTVTRTRDRDRYDRGRTTTHRRDRYDRGRTTTTTTTTRRTRVYRDTPATTVRVERTYREPVRRTTVVTRPARRTTVVNHHHHHHGPSSGASTGTVQRAPAPAPVQEASIVDGYLTASVAAAALEVPEVFNGTLPGIDYQVGVGGKSGWLAAELGFNMGGYRLNPAASESDLTLLGLTADVKLQPSFGFVEPYVMAGVGGHVLTDHPEDTSSSGASLRLGGGIDFRIENVALSAQYLRTGYGLANDGGWDTTDGEVGATTESVGLGLKFYF